MTGYELFNKVYMHHMGQFTGHISLSISYKEYVSQAFQGLLNEYSIDTSSPTAVILSYDANKMLLNIEQLQAIELLAGYWLCHYDGHTGDWRLIHYDSRDKAKVSYKRLYSKYFKCSDWFWIHRVQEVI